MNHLRMLGLVAATSAAATLAMAAPADAAAKAAPTGTVKAIARPCTTTRVAHFRVALKHLTAGKVYELSWTAPTRSGGTEVTEIPIDPSSSKYVAANIASRAPTPLLARTFKTTLVLTVANRAKPQLTTTVAVPKCTPRK